MEVPEGYYRLQFVMSGAQMRGGIDEVLVTDGECPLLSKYSGNSLPQKGNIYHEKTLAITQGRIDKVLITDTDCPLLTKYSNNTVG